MKWQAAYRVGIRLVFLFAFAAFLFASIRHVAVFFHNFEGEKNDWVNPYMLAVSIDATSLMLTIGIMFFSKGMPWYAKMITWLFIIGLTGFSWIVNWEYARTFQGFDLKTGHFLQMLNPILASSFAFLNLAYSVVAEFFDTKTKTAGQLQEELEQLTALESVQAQLNDFHNRNRKPSFIQRAKDTAIEAKQAVKQVLSDEIKPESDTHQSASQDDAEHVASSVAMEVIDGTAISIFTSTAMEPEEEIDSEISGTCDGTDEEVKEDIFDDEDGSEYGTDVEIDTDPQMEVTNVTQFHRPGTLLVSGTSAKGKSSRRKPFTVAEAAQFLHCSERHVRELRKSGTLISDADGLVTSASVKAYKKKRSAKIGMEGA